MGLAVGFLSPAPAHAQDAAKVKQLFDEGMLSLQKGEFDAALAKFKALFQEDPNQAVVLDLIRSTETKSFLKMLEKGGEFELVAKRLLSMGHVAAKERSKDRERILPLVETAIKDTDLEKRRTASRTIMANHGAFAVPELVRYLGSNDTDERVRAIFVLEDIGVEAILPLVEVLNSPDAQVRQTTIIALRKLADPRAYPILEWVASSKDQPDSVRRAADNALRAMGDMMGKSDLTPEQAFLKLADMYYTKAPDLLTALGSVNTIWKWEEGQLKHADAPAFLYHLRLAEKACMMAIQANPQSTNARSMLAIVYAAQQVSLASATQEFMDSELGKSEMARLAMADAAIRSSGPSVLMGALGIALKYNDAPVAIAILKALPTYGNVPVDSGSTLVAALSYPDQRIQWNAALTCIRLNPKEAFPRSAEIVGLVSGAVSLSSVRQALLIVDDTKAAVQMATDLTQAGMHAVRALSGSDGLNRSKQVPFDVVIVASPLKDIMADEIVHDIRRDFRTSKTPILVAVPESQAEATKALYGSQVEAVITTPLSANVYVPVVKDAAAKSPLNDRDRALALSEEACAVLAEASTTGVFDFSKAAPALVGTLNTNKPDSLKMKALAALKKWGNEGNAPGLLDAVAMSTNAEAVRAESARIAGIVMSGKAPTAKGFEILVAGLSDASVQVRVACAGALGACKLTDAQRAMVMQKAKL
jgi:HEAT repeat protein